VRDCPPTTASAIATAIAIHPKRVRIIAPP
jgi:hypothetical protein